MVWIELARGNLAYWAAAVFVLIALASIFAGAKAITWARGADARRHAGYLRDTHNGTNA